MIKVVSVDLGGVLFTEGRKVLTQLNQKHNYDDTKIFQLIRGRHSKAAADWRRGKISEEKFWNNVEDNLPRHYDVGLIKKMWWDGYELDQNFFVLAKKIKNNGYKIMAFSGNVKDRINYLEKKYNFRKLFDREVYSFEHGLIKRDQAFYDILIAEAGCAPGEIVHIDNQKKVKKICLIKGINFILYKKHNIEKLKQKLSAIGVEHKNY